MSERALRSDVTAVARSLHLEPVGSRPADARRVKVKSDPAYYVLTGIRSEPEGAARNAVLQRLRALGWKVVETRASEGFLGWQARATKNGAVLRAQVGSGATNPSGTPYAPLAGRSYVQLAVASEDSGPAWASVPRDR